MRAPVLLALLALLAGAFVLSSCSTASEQILGTSDDPEPKPIIDPRIYEALKTEPEVEVLMSLRPLDLPVEQRTIELQRQHAAEMEESVLSTLTEADFTLIRQFEIVPSLQGLITQTGLDKLAVNPDVVDIGLDCCLYGN